jgi:hypothetical protein
MVIVNDSIEQGGKSTIAVRIADIDSDLALWHVSLSGKR